ncbi:GmrSD restriction endonuclease domain-containing protein [Vibrio sp. K4]|uniref:GmrSD restriction endonuclease domain-containing protein n=1 Tax=Vibrio sp. K4 TaxID=3391579 RepID=UPI003DA71526
MSTKSNAELDVTSIRVQKLIEKIEDGAIKVPEFQRGYVWKPQQVIELLESIVKNYPVGSILLWEAEKGDKLQSSRHIAGINLPEVPDKYPVQYCLDGQQRISTLFGVFWQNAVAIGSSQYNPEQGVFEVYYDLEEDCFVHANELDTIDEKRYFYLRNLLSNEKQIDVFMTHGYEKEVMQKVSKLSSKFLNYDMPIIQISNRAIDEVGVIFERINNTGVKLNTMDLMTAWTWDEEFHLRDEIDELLEELEAHCSFKLDSTLILQITSSILNNSTSSKSILSINPTTFKDNWPDICKAIKQAIEHLSADLLCKSGKFLPNKQLLCGMSYFFHRCPKPNAKQVDALNAWFWITSFNRRYDGGNTTQKMDHDLSTMERLIEGEKASKIEALKVTEEVLMKSTFSIRSSLTRTVLLLQAQHSPMDMISGTKINIGKVLAQYNRSEFHHVFPDAFLKNAQGVSNKDERYTLLNFCFLSSASNKKIGAKAPSEYFKTLLAKGKEQSILDSNLLPNELSIYGSNHYKVFIRRRAKLIIATVTNMVKGK